LLIIAKHSTNSTLVGLHYRLRFVYGVRNVFTSVRTRG